MMMAASGTATGSGRAFAIVATILGALGLGFSVPFTVISFIDDEQALHQLHNLEAMALYGVLLGGGLLVAARRPDAQRSAFLVAAASGIAGTISGVISGDFVSGVWYSAPIALAILWWLHPQRHTLLRARGIEPVSAILSLSAAVPAIAWALSQARLQREGFAADPHVELHHHSGAAAAALALVLCGLAASVRVPGRRVGAWLVGATALILGVGSLMLSERAGAMETIWAWLSAAWGVAFVALAEVRRSPSSETAS